MSAPWGLPDELGRYATWGRAQERRADHRPPGVVVGDVDHVSADRRWFWLGGEQWEEFQHLLSQPARTLPRLRALLDTDQETQL